MSLGVVNRYGGPAGAGEKPPTIALVGESTGGRPNVTTALAARDEGSSRS